MTVRKNAFEHNVEKEKMLVTSSFPAMFPTLEKTNALNKPQLICCLQMLFISKSIKFVLWLNKNLYKWSVYTRVSQKDLILIKKGWHNRESFSLFFDIVPLNINTLGQAMCRHSNPLKEDGCTLPPFTLSLQHGLFPNWQPERCDLSLGNKEKSDRAESGELGGSCSNSKPK